MQAWKSIAWPFGKRNGKKAETGGVPGRTQIVDKKGYVDNFCRKTGKTGICRHFAGYGRVGIIHEKKKLSTN